LPINFISPKNFKVRRVAHYQGISRVSNEIEIRIRSTHSNSICCSQILTSNNGVFTQPTILIGSIPTFNYSVIPTNYSLISFTISYQWQRQTRTSPWSNILGATNKDYLPISETYNYRRIAKVDYQIRRNSTNLNQTYSTFSNTVEVEKRVRGNTASKSNDIGKSEIFIYPNPVNDIMYIKGVDTTEMLNFRLFDLLGKEYFANYIIDSKSDEGYFDFSGLSVGIYFLHLTNNSNELIIKKIIKSN
ncbi:T9SS type A sorting domain-containing protein, partial [Flavobacterium sp.]|uniref:T9SS type A sorting domain-containing protein n=1 Tax=Flavobacterium sp. TaxID=239 RepID=UPI0025C3528D